MNIRFSGEILKNKSNWRLIQDILSQVDRGWHAWLVEDPVGLESSDWYEAASQLDRELFERSAAQAAYPDFVDDSIFFLDVAEQTDHEGAEAAAVRLAGGDVPTRIELTLSAQDAHTLATEPVRILVEDQESDGAFLTAVIRAIAPDLDSKLKSRSPAIEYDHSGGSGGIPRRAQYWAQRAPILRLRLLAICDSDAPLPNQPNGNIEKSADDIRALGVVCHILTRRAIENYVPLGALEGWASTCRDEQASRRQQLVTTFRKLTSGQRAHFDMKYGFQKTPARIPRHQSDLYRGLDDADVQALGHGFGQKIWKLFTNTDAPGQIRMEAETDTTGVLKSELEHIVALIRARL